MKRIASALAGATVAYAGGAAADEPVEVVQLSLGYTADVIAVVDGGVDSDTYFLDNLDVVLDADLERLWGWRGTSAHIDLLNNSGDMPNDGAGTLQGVDNIEVASQRARLFEAWVETAWGDNSVRAGLYDLNSEFYANESAGLLIGPAFGIGSELAATGPNGPSIFPSTALAARFQRRFDGDFVVRAAALNASAGVLGDPDGIDTSFDNGALLIAEGGIEGDNKLTVGAWTYTEKQDDIREVDTFGDPLRQTARGAYVVFERALNDPEGPRATHGFVRAGFSDGDTTAFSGGWQAGFLVERVFAGRPSSAFSFGVNQGHISDGYRQNQIDLGASMEDSETQVELTYSDQVLSFLTIQPDLQWTLNPGGDRSIEDAFVAGLRFSVSL